MTEGEDAVYVYGVLPGAELRSLSVSGVQGAEVGVVRHADLAALTSPLAGDAVGARDVRAHWRVLEEAFKHATVLPLRFGTVLESADAVRDQLLEVHGEAIREMLAVLENRVQLNVKGRYREEVLLGEIVRESREVAALRRHLQTMPDDARAYGHRVRLGELVAAEVARRRDHDTRMAVAALEPLAVSVIEERPTDEHAAFNLAFLVERSAQEKFDQAVGAVKQELGKRLELSYVGPSLPYSFAEADLGAGSAAWA